MWRRAMDVIVRLALLTVAGASACARGKPPTQVALDCKQIDGWSRPFHREFFLDIAAQRAWGDQAKNGIFEIDVRSSTAEGVSGVIRAKCPPDDPESCRVQRVVRYDFELPRHRLLETMRNDSDGALVQTLHYDCASLPLDRSLVVRKLAEQGGR